MMDERLRIELDLVRSWFPDLEFRENDLWARVPGYPLDPAIWGATSCEVAFRFVLPGQPPYAFWVRPGLTLASGGTISNYSYPVQTPFGEGWGQFSWAPDVWSPGPDVAHGPNMLMWAKSFAGRLSEGA